MRGKWTFWLALAVIATTSAHLIAYFLKAQFWGYDFAVYWRVANEPIRGAYSPRDWPFAYLPTMLLWVQPLALIQWLPAYLIWISGSAIAFWLACRPHLSHRALLLVFLSPPLLKCLRAGQISVALAAMLLTGCSIKNRILAGAIFGLIASIKPQLVLTAPLLLLFNRDWRALWSAGAVFACSSILATAAFGPSIWSAWAQSLPQFHQALIDGNFLRSAASPAAVAERLGVSPIPFLLLGCAMGILLAYRCRAGTPLEQCAAITAGSIFATPYSMHYDLVGILPCMAVLVTKGRPWPILTMLGSFNPVPVAVAALELLRSAISRAGKAATQ